MKEVLAAFLAFSNRMAEDHMGAYAAACAYFLILSFVPFYIIFLAIERASGLDPNVFAEAVVQLMPAGLKSFMETVIEEMSNRPNTYLPLSIVILIWSAAKAFHVMTNGLNTISRVKETRGWFFLRFRSMALVVVFLAGVYVTIRFLMLGERLSELLSDFLPTVGLLVEFFYPFRSLFAYIGLLIVFIFFYKILPNHHYTIRSQLPGALIVTTVWSFFSYLMDIYYKHSRNFMETYGSLTGIILAMIWLFFCMYFVLIGAELNRIIYEDPDNNFLVSTVEGFEMRTAEKDAAINERIEREVEEARIRAEKAEEIPSAQPEDIVIPWEDEE